MANKRSKISIIGAGHVGATAAHWAALERLGDIVLIDIVEGLAAGKALDLCQAGPVYNCDFVIRGGQEYDASKDSDIVIVTAAVPRKPGMSRDDLLEINTKIVHSVIGEVAKRSPEAVIIMVANPLDVMTWVARQVSGFPDSRVVGMAGILDTARFRTFLAQELDCSVEDVQAYVLGGHGDSMVPLVRYSSMGGIPITELLSKEKIDAIVQRTRDGGAEIVSLLKTGSAFYAPAAAVVSMAASIIHDKKRVLPCAAFLNGEFGYRGFPLGVPTKLGAGGVEQIIEVPLQAEEKAALAKSAEAVQATINKAKTLLEKL